jgi:hypothetical protein
MSKQSKEDDLLIIGDTENVKKSAKNSQVITLFRRTLNDTIVKLCKRASNSTQWKNYIKRITKQKGIGIEFNQLRNLERGKSSNINLYIAILSAVLEREEKVTLEITKEGFKILENES